MTKCDCNLLWCDLSSLGKLTSASVYLISCRRLLCWYNNTLIRLLFQHLPAFLTVALWDNIITNITAGGCFSSQRPSRYCVLLFTFSDSKKTVSQTVNLIAGKLELMRTSNTEFTTNTNPKKHPFNTNKWLLSVRARPPGHRVPICHSFVGGKDPLWRWWDQN